MKGQSSCVSRLKKGAQSGASGADEQSASSVEVNSWQCVQDVGFKLMPMSAPQCGVRVVSG